MRTGGLGGGWGNSGKQSVSAYDGVIASRNSDDKRGRIAYFSAGKYEKGQKRLKCLLRPGRNASLPWIYQDVRNGQNGVIEWCRIAGPAVLLMHICASG